MTYQLLSECISPSKRILSFCKISYKMKGLNFEGHNKQLTLTIRLLDYFTNVKYLNLMKEDMHLEVNQ